MKRTSATAPKASRDTLRHLACLPRRVRWTLAAALLVCAGATFLLGRGTAPESGELLRSVQALQKQIHLQQGAVDRLSVDSRQSVNAQAAPRAEIQAASTRQDSQGEPQAQNGQL